MKLGDIHGKWATCGAARHGNAVRCDGKAALKERHEDSNYGVSCACMDQSSVGDSCMI